MLNKIYTKSPARFLKYVFNSKKFYSTKKEPQKSKYPHKIFSGIQPTGSIHLGNYIGAVFQWVKLQESNKNKMILSIVDLHSITLPHNPKTLSKNIIEMTATLLACGIDPDKVILFQQSSIQAHTHLCWCLGCISTMARLAHLPTFKEKSAALKEVPLGLFVYPVLQAADILAYKATCIPVGEDQHQNIQLAQDLARMFNSRFGETFPIPRTLITGSDYSRVRSLRDPIKKMSKSDPDPKSRISLNDPPTEIVKKIKKAVTDFTSEVTYNPNERPGVSNLISIHSFMTGKSIDEICEEVKSLNTLQYKMLVADTVVSHVQPIQEKIANYLSDQQYLLNVLKLGAEKANEIAEKTLNEVKYKLGLKLDDVIKERMSVIVNK